MVDESICIQIKLCFVSLERFTCSECNKSYAHRQSLSRHRNIHKRRCKQCKRL